MPVIMKSAPLILALLCFAPAAHAQPIERETLPPIKPYTMSTETDPMAMDPAAVAPVEKSVNRGEAQVAPPPPGPNSIPHSSMDSSPADSSSSYSTEPAPVRTGPAPSANDYPNNNVSGVVPADESAFANRKFCTLKVSFGSMCCGIDRKTADKIKSYLDGNPGLLTYTRSNWGKEGEYDYCIDIPDHKNRGKVYVDLKKLLPRKGDEEGKTTVSGKGFEPVKNYP